MTINELEMNQDSVFRDIQCKMAIKQRIISKSGRVEMTGDNLFKFITKDNVIDFSIVDKNDAKLIMDSFNRHFFCLAILTVEYGTVGNPIFVKGKVLWQDRCVKKKGMLQSSEIRNGVKRFNRLVSDNVRFDSIDCAPNWAT